MTPGTKNLKVFTNVCPQLSSNLCTQKTAPDTTVSALFFGNKEKYYKTETLCEIHTSKVYNNTSCSDSHFQLLNITRSPSSG